MTRGFGPPSRSQVEKAGKTLRRIFREDPSAGGLDTCLDVIARHRQTHARPMLTANVGMRRYAQDLGLEVQVTQRLKRMQTIIEKLTTRESQMNLSRMRDIGGVRVILGDLESLRCFQDRVVERRHKKGVDVIDYVEHPRQSGYRAVHLICKYDGGGVVRPVEVQLRTPAMHSWAVAVEEVSALTGVNHKCDGYTPFHRWALLWSRKLEALELGRPADAFDDELRSALVAIMEGGG